MQLTVIRQKYDRLEVELREKRQKGKEEMAEFMEDNVLVKWTKLRNQRRKIETRVEHSHEVRVYKCYYRQFISCVNWHKPNKLLV